MRTLGPLVRVFLDKLADGRQAELESVSVDTAVEDIVRRCCVQIVFTIHRYEGFVKSQREADLESLRCASGLDRRRSLKNIAEYEKQVRKYLSDTTSLTFADVRGALVEVRCRSTGEVTEFLMKEISEAVNSELSNHFGRGESRGGRSKESKPPASSFSSFTRKTTVGLMVRRLQTCAARMACLSSSSVDETSSSPDVESDTCVISLNEDNTE